MIVYIVIETVIFLNFLNKSRQESLFLRPVIILIALFCILKMLVLFVDFPQHIIPYDILEWKQA
jgi:hypothetical protein